MARRSKIVNPLEYRKKPKKRRGVHAKSKSSKLKSSKNYIKKYRGQG